MNRETLVSTLTKMRFHCFLNDRLHRNLVRTCAYQEFWYKLIQIDVSAFQGDFLQTIKKCENQNNPMSNYTWGKINRSLKNTEFNTDKLKNSIPEEIEEEVSDLEANYSFEYETSSPENSYGVVVYFRVKLPEHVVLNGIDLGTFTANIHVHRDNIMILVSADNPRFEISGYYFHPHVSTGGSVCMGSGLELMQSVCRSGRIDNAIELIKSALQCYNPDSSYRPLSYWKG